MKRGWVLAADIRKADSDEENMREAGWVEVVLADDYDKVIGALKGARETIHDEFCSSPRCHPLCEEPTSVLRELAAHRESNKLKEQK